MLQMIIEKNSEIKADIRAKEQQTMFIKSALCKYFKVSNGTMYHTLKMYNVWEKYIQDDLRWY
ncbi:hypothetical protein KJK83_001666 [Campylobacter jejuni]|nr:hypothetical protein [Campylobacter jejuni]EHN6902931.1 hypothetical protein [Campylobacter jejuni]